VQVLIPGSLPEQPSGREINIYNKELTPTMRKWIRSLLLPPASDMDQLLAKAHSFPRFEKHAFTFRELKFAVTDFLSVAYQIKEYFVDERMKFKSNNLSPVIYDCGSNAGVSVIYFKKLFPKSKIYAFEPDPQVFECLKKNLKDNNINDVILSDKAIWTNNDFVEFGKEGADGGSLYREGNKIRVPSVRLKELLSKEVNIDCLKMDIEGAETEVLTDCGDALSKVNYLFVEYHSWKSSPQKLDELLHVLSQNGFRYTIHSIGEQVHQPFIDQNSTHPMDVQLDIYAINNRIHSELSGQI
jgi:FkbM family methyltransferase